MIPGHRAVAQSSGPCTPDKFNLLTSSLEDLPIRHQEQYSKHWADLTNAFSNMFHCTNCNSEQPMTIKTICSARYGGRDILFCQCEELRCRESRVCGERPHAVRRAR
jgi:hypothetical protein